MKLARCQSLFDFMLVLSSIKRVWFLLMIVEITYVIFSMCMDFGGSDSNWMKLYVPVFAFKIMQEL